MNTIRYTFPRTECLKSRKLIEQLFALRSSFTTSHIRLFWLETSLPLEGLSIQYAFTVSKRNYKRAVDRNRIKRLMREAVRLHKFPFTEALRQRDKTYALLFLYTGKQILSYAEVEVQIQQLFKDFLAKTA